MIHLKEGRSRYETRTFSVVYLRRAEVSQKRRNARRLAQHLLATDPADARKRERASLT